MIAVVRLLGTLGKPGRHIVCPRCQCRHAVTAEVRKVHCCSMLLLIDRR